MKLRSICVVAALSTLLPSDAEARIECGSRDRSFESFLERFEEDVPFQRSRLVLPLVYRSGDYATTDVAIELLDLKRLEKLEHPLILSSNGRKEENVEESTLLSTKRYAEVFHDGPLESDLYRILYQFRNIDGCWFLEAVHDRSL